MSIRGASGRRRSIGASEHQPAEHQAGGGALEQAQQQQEHQPSAGTLVSRAAEHQQLRSIGRGMTEAAEHRQGHHGGGGASAGASRRRRSIGRGITEAAEHWQAGGQDEDRASIQSIGRAADEPSKTHHTSCKLLGPSRVLLEKMLNKALEFQQNPKNVNTKHLRLLALNPLNRNPNPPKTAPKFADRGSVNSCAFTQSE